LVTNTLSFTISLNSKRKLTIISVNLHLSDIAKKHDEWIKVAIYVGAAPSVAEDYVQDMYIKLSQMEEREGNLNRIRNNQGEVNTVYIFKILSNFVIDAARKPSKTISLDGQIEDIGELNIMSEKAYSELITCIRECIDSMHQYDKMLLELHFVYGMSMRNIEKQTKIPKHSVFNTLKNAKQKIKNKASAKFNQYLEEKHDEETRYGGRRCSGEDNGENGD